MLSPSLNIVLVTERCHVHSAPISRAVFEQFYRVIGKTFAALFQGGMGVIAGPRVAYLELREQAKESGSWDQVNNGLIAEIVRLTNCAVPGEGGWRSLPFQVAIDQKLIDEEQVADILGQLVFFTCVSTMNLKAQVPAMLAAMGELWGSAATSSGFTEYVASLSTLTADASSGATASTSSVPA